MNGEEYAVIVTGSAGVPGVGDVDFFLTQRDVPLPPAGSLSIYLEEGEAGVRVSAMRPDSPAIVAGFLPGDRILNIAGEAISGIDDVRLALLDRAPGEQVWVEVERTQTSGSKSRQANAVTLI
jgi:C-terminal processing protease CtpA/Prc